MRHSSLFKNSENAGHQKSNEGDSGYPIEIESGHVRAPKLQRVCPPMKYNSKRSVGFLFAEYLIRNMKKFKIQMEGASGWAMLLLATGIGWASVPLAVGAEDMNYRISGAVVDISSRSLTVQNEKGTFQLHL